MEVIEDCIKQWKNVNFQELKSELDSHEVEIAKQIELCTTSRSTLASSTKEFRKLTDPEEKLKVVGHLVKSYQEEVDRLTRRAKLSEKEFLNVFRALYSVEDPCSALEKSLEAYEELEETKITNDNLRHEIEEKNKEFVQLSNQSSTIQSLQQEIEKLKKAHENELRNAVESTADSISRENFDSIAKFELMEREFTSKIEQLQSECKTLKKQLEKSQEEVIEIRTLSEEHERELQNEIDVYTDEVNRLQAQIQCSNNAAADTVDTSRDQEFEEDRKRVLEVEDELIRRQKIESTLRDEITQLKISLDLANQRTSDQAKVLTEQEESLKSTIYRLETELSKRVSEEAYQKLQTQLRLLQGEEIGDDLLGSDLPLAIKNRNLEREMAQLQSQLQEMSFRLNQAFSENQSLNEVVKDNQTSIDKLRQENEILVLRNSRSTNDMIGEASSSGNIEPSSMSADFLLEATQDMATAAGGGGSQREMESYLGIVKDQRDEFRKRMLELETSKSRLTEQMKDMSIDMDHLKAENHMLRQDIQVLQTRDSAPLQRKAGVTKRDSIDPFGETTSFRTKRSHSRIDAFDRLTFMVSNRVLSNKNTRMALVGYLIFMHLLVLYMLFIRGGGSH